MRYYSYILDGIDYFIIYEGEYENGLKNGKGIEYKKFDSDEEYLRLDLQKAFYEGEFLDGKKNGKGKEYSVYGDLEFEGEYLNGERWNGKGKEYENYKVIFEGEYLNGERWEGKYYQFTDSTKTEVKLYALYQKGKMICV